MVQADVVELNHYPHTCLLVGNLYGHCHPAVLDEETGIYHIAPKRKTM